LLLLSISGALCGNALVHRFDQYSPFESSGVIMSWMKERGVQAPRAQAGAGPSQRKSPASRDSSEEFVEAFIDALRDILQDERPRAA
jgi:hypothetical protein